MTATEAATQPPRDAAGHEFYDRAVWPWGEDGDIGVMVEGHGRRALAALSAYGRGVDGRGWLPGLLYEATEKWVIVRTSCGCTSEEHAQHLTYVDQPAAGPCDCTHVGLPPCDTERYAWTVAYVAEGTPGAVALTVVHW